MFGKRASRPIVLEVRSRCQLPDLVGVCGHRSARPSLSDSFCSACRTRRTRAMQHAATTPTFLLDTKCNELCGNLAECAVIGWSTQGREMCPSEACDAYTLRRTHGGCHLLWPKPLHLNTEHASFFLTAVNLVLT